MNENYETQLRVALDERAHEIELPEGLAERTLETVRTLRRETLRDRWLARRDSRAPITGYPRWTYAVAGVAAVVLLFAVGSVVVRSPSKRASHDMIAGPVNGAVERAAPSTSGSNASNMTSGNIDASTGDGRFVAGASSAGGANIAAPAPPPTTKIEKSADINVQVGDFDKAWASANDIAARNGGYTTDSTTTQTGDHVGSGTVTMHVPVTHLDATLRDLRHLGTLISLTTQGRDVSQPVADLAARRKAAEAEADRLTTLMSEAGTLDAVDSIRSQLNGTQSEIEKLKAQEASYQHDIDNATINATVTEQANRPAGTLLGSSTLGHAFGTAKHVAATVIAGLIVLLAGLLPLALLGLLIWLGVRIYRRRAA